MKKMILCFIAVCTAMTMQAQEIDWTGLTIFTDELEALQGEHVSCDTMTHRELLDDLGTEIISDSVTDALFAKLDKKDFRLIKIASSDGIGRENIYKVLDKYEVTTAEVLFGIPLLFCERSNGAQAMLFVGDKASLMIMDYGDSMEVLYLNTDLMEIIKDVFTAMMIHGNGGNITIGESGDLQFSYSFSRTTEHITTERKKNEGEEPKVYSFDQQSRDNDLYGRFNEEINKVTAKATASANAAKAQEVADLEKPAFIVNLETGRINVAIPAVPEEVRKEMQPYATYGVYDWINGLGFGKGAMTDSADQKSEIILPEDVARLYAVKHQPQEKWNEEGYSPMFKAIYRKEYQGGTPAVLYRHSKNEMGYKDMLRDLGFLFKLELGETYRNLKVTQQSERNGKRFVQLYGEGRILMCVFDSPEDKYCHMSILIGGGGGFEQAVNEYVIGGERDIAEKCNIIINSDLSDGSGGIHFTTDEYFFAGKSHKNGVHIDFKYWDLYTK